MSNIIFKRDELIQSIKEKCIQGWTLDDKCLATDRITYINGEFQTLTNKRLVVYRNRQDAVHIAYMDKDRPTALQKYIDDINAGYSLCWVSTPHLFQIERCMVRM